ncbi:hypothetical protein PVL29_005137 [Vitis rotundifolia]|uniref:Uncharacterized protein n=1 Tax=Vitis rotundifolia TaxID=103349 RepID=A0AA39E3G8_VITRO|nr:hypothetical protein PVL29_005137 [Vitis rotundifolia]
MISAVDEIRRLLESSSSESYYRSLTKTICAFVAGFSMAFVFAFFIVSCIIRRLRGYACGCIPVHIYGPGPSSSCAATTSYELQACAICLCEFENGERGSDGGRRRMFGVDELLMGVENPSPPALLAPNFPSSGMTISSTPERG